jgi:PAS domain S-box-containing protein
MEPTLLQLAIGLLQNAAVLVLGVLCYCWLRGPVSPWSRWAREPLEGLVCAGLAVLCMSNPLWLSPGVQIDSRNAIVAVATLFSGPVAGLIAAAAAAGYRLWIGGVGAQGGAIGAVGAYLVSLPFWYWLGRTKTPLGYRHVATLALAIGVLMLLALPIQPAAVATEMLQRAGIPGLTIVPGSVFVLGSIVLRLERGRAAERALEESEARFRSIIDNLPDPLTIKDRDNKVLLVNKAFEEATGFAAEGLVGRSIDKVWEDIGGSSAFADLARRVWETGKNLRSEPLTVRHRDRQYSWVVTSFPMRDSRGEIDSIGAVTTDVTGLVKARAELEAREASLRRQQEALVDIVRDNAASKRSFIEAVRTLTEVTGAVIEVDRTVVRVMDRETGTASCLDDWERRAGRHGHASDLEMGRFGQLLTDLERERVLAIEDAFADERIAWRRAIMREHNVGALMIAGSYIGAQMEGYVCFVHRGGKRQWTAEELAFARSVADLFALMLLTSRHREALAALDLATDAIYVEREDGRVIYANRPALALAGLSVDASQLPSKSLPRPAQALADERDLQEVSWPVSGAMRDLELRRARLPDGGVVTVIEDITAKKSEQRDRERIELHLQQASKMAAVGQLAGGVAHDFNNLLGAVIGFARFLEQDLPADTPQHGFAQRILSACNRGKDLVAQILSFTRARALERHPVDLRTVIEEARELLAGSLPATTRLVVEPGAAPLVVQGNEAQLQQVLVNLCLNAHDALGGEPGEIRVMLAPLRPGAADYRRPLIVGQLDARQRYARLDVIDTGSGIAAESLPRIFEPFFTTKERGRGTGLGLAVVHGIITSYDGACGVDSRPAQGARFSVYLPLVERVASPQATGGDLRDLRGRERVLVVDDEVDITDMLSVGLERLGYEVAALNDPTVALAVVGEEPRAWDAVITDQLMPGMQGLVLAEKLKALRPDLIVILCTGLDDGVVSRSATLQGVDAFFAKPVEPDQLAAAIRDLSGS